LPVARTVAKFSIRALQNTKADIVVKPLV